MKKNGFLFIESIACITMLLAVLVTLYAAFSNGFQEEDKRIYYDDITYMYKTMDIRDYVINSGTFDDINKNNYVYHKNYDHILADWTESAYLLDSFYYIPNSETLEKIKKEDLDVSNDDDLDYIKTINPEYPQNNSSSTAKDMPIFVAKYVTSKSGNDSTNQTFKECMEDSSKKKNDCLIVTYYSWVYA